MASPGRLAVALHERVLDAEMIEDAGDDEVDHLLDSRFARVKTGRGGEDDRARARHAEHVLDMNFRERRLARDENELAALLEAHVRRALDQVRRGARGESAERSAGAG